MVHNTQYTIHNTAVWNPKFFVLSTGFTFLILVFGFWVYSYAEDKKVEPVIVNGDTVEYITEKKEVIATGNVVVNYKGSKLTCDKLTVNTFTKDAEAEGNARLEDKKGILEGKKIIYNFQTKTGVITDGQFRSSPYFGRSEVINRVSENEFIARRGYMTTCTYDQPHWRMKSRRINFFPGDKVQTKEDTAYMGRIPLFYLPQYSHSLKDPIVHVQLMPGKTKDWGAYMLSAWRYNLTKNINGRVYFDYREKLGVSEGFGANYNSSDFGKGDLKYYYTQERSRLFLEGVPAEFQRYFIRWRHQWDIGDRTALTSEYWKINDSKRMLHGTKYNILKDYFLREYEKDSLPLSYTYLHHSLDYSSIDFILQKRTNRWYSQVEKLPEIKYSMPSYQVGESPFYFQNNSSYLNYNYKYAVPSPSWDDVAYNNVDTTNKISLPTKAAFFSLNPFFSGQQTYNDKDRYGSTLNVNFSTGSDLSTKFYRLFNAKSDFLGMDINGLRHIITPSVTYSYTHSSVMPAGKARFGGGASSAGASASLGLSNKLQTKRNNKSVDLVDFLATSTYAVKPKTGDKRGSNLSDILYELKLLPYSWLRIDADATYERSGNRSDANYNKFSNLNYDANFDWGKDRSLGFGQRYYRKGGNELTYNFTWRFNPKWKFGFYQRYERGHEPTLKRGLKETQYTVSRDLHCWVIDFTYNVKREQGEGVWMVFRLKAFPELEFEYNQTYHEPKPGSQSNL